MAMIFVINAISWKEEFSPKFQIPKNSLEIKNLLSKIFASDGMKLTQSTGKNLFACTEFTVPMPVEGINPESIFRIRFDIRN